jgi:hypothetical protein
MLVHMLHMVMVKTCPSPHMFNNQIDRINLKYPLNIRGGIIVLHAIVRLRQSQSFGGN